MSYKPGGKGYGQRPDIKPSWVGLEVLERNQFTVRFKTATGYKLVPAYQVERWEQQTGSKI
jgi:hypothetical protein